MKRPFAFVGLLALLLGGVAFTPAARAYFALTGAATASFTGTQTSMISGITATFPGAVSPSVRYTSGTGNGQVSVLYIKTDTIAASGADTIDLRGVVTDPFGATVSLSTLKAMIVTAASGNTNNVLVGGQATGAAPLFFGNANDVITVKPGGWFGTALPNTGFTVSSGTDSLRIANSGAGSTVIYTIMVMGT